MNISELLLSKWNERKKKKEKRKGEKTNLSLSRDLSSSMRLRRSSSRCSRKRCAARACCLSSSNFRCRSSFCLSRTSFALSTSFALPVDSRPENNREDRLLLLVVRASLETRRRLLVSQTVLDNKSVVHIAHLNSEINFNETISSYLQSSVRHETKDWLTIRQREKCQRFGAHSMFKQPREKCEKRKVSTLPLKTWYLRSR